MKLPSYSQYEEMILPVRSELLAVKEYAHQLDSAEEAFLLSKKGVITELEDRLDELEILLIDETEKSGSPEAVKLLIEETKESLEDLFLVKSLKDIELVSSDKTLYVLLGDWLSLMSDMSSETKEKINSILATTGVILPKLE